MESVAALQALLLAVAFVNSQMPSAFELESRALEARRAIKSGRMEVSHLRRTYTDGNTVTQRFRDRIAFDADKLRFDFDAGNRVTYRQVLSNSSFIQYVNRDRTIVEMGDVNYGGGRRNMVGMYHPLVMGMVSSNPGLWYNAREDRHLCTYRDLNPRVTFDEETRSYRIQYDFSDTSTLTMLISPEVGYGVTLVERNSIVDGKQLRTAASSKYEQFDQHWFPKSIVCTRHVAGTLLYQQDVEITNAEFNCDVDANEFELTTMEIPPGTLVSMRPGGQGTLMWDGTALVKREGQIETASVQQSRPFLRWSIVCAAAALVLALLIARARRHK